MTTGKVIDVAVGFDPNAQIAPTRQGGYTAAMLRYLFVLMLVVMLTGCAANLPGVYDLPLPARCEAWIFTEESHVKEWAVALACPGIALLRLYPWPPVQPWDEAT